MSKLSEKKIKKIKEEILSLLFSNNLKPMFTSEIAYNLIRDEEFIKKLLFELKKERLIIEIDKSPKGHKYSKWRRWTLNSQTYKAYKQLLTS